MRTLEYIIPEEYDGRPLLHYLKEGLGISTFIIRRLRNNRGAVLINGEHFRVVDRVCAGQKLTLHIIEITTPPLPLEMDLDIIFEDEDILIINKPSGISVHPTFNHPNGTLCNAVATYLIKKYNEPAAGRAIGRLDKVTSGVMVFAKNSLAASKLNGNMDKKYNAIAWGEMEESGTVNAPIFRPDKGKTVRCVDPRGDEAVTHWRLIKNLGDISFIEVVTETGRTHQIRVHCDHIGHPLVGDEMYSSPTTDNIKRASLHCREISFNHPITNEYMTFIAPLPEDMRKELEAHNFHPDK